MTRRPDGTLEREVLHALWEIGVPASPADVIDHMGTDLAYTSIATILGRLCDKGVVQRARHGRAFRYTASSTEADMTAERITSILDAATDRDSALAGFARALDADDAARLRALLKDAR